MERSSTFSIMMMLFSAVIVLWGVYERVVNGGANALLSVLSGAALVVLLLGFSRSSMCLNCLKRVKTQ